MTSPLRLGFLYDPGISRFPHQTSAGSTGERIALSLPLTLYLSPRASLSRHSCIARSRHAAAARRQQANSIGPLAHGGKSPTDRPNETNATRLERRLSNEEILRLSTDTRSDLRVFSTRFAALDKARPSPCPRCCHTTRARWAATARTARSARCPLAADCRTRAPFSPRRRRRDPRSWDRSAEPREVNTRAHTHTFHRLPSGDVSRFLSKRVQWSGCRRVLCHVYNGTTDRQWWPGHTPCTERATQRGLFRLKQVVWFLNFSSMLFFKSYLWGKCARPKQVIAKTKVIDWIWLVHVHAVEFDGTSERISLRHSVKAACRPAKTRRDLQ